ncbi:flotillin-1 isoform X3 [Ursus arctos]|uniref:flotillin-1 isoform X3 n=1 Tax=Ursus arctos TaxID=9644 RepID=UPI002547E2F2|nr:flotillin-1 isoform X3 [Ursus arctos]
MFFTCGPNEAMVVSGFCRSPPVMVAGGRVFVLPCIQQIQRISLNTLTLNVKSEKVYTRHGVPISVTGIAQVKIQGQNKEMLAAACQMFLGKTEAEIAHIALETLEGHQRAIMAHMTVEDYLHSLGKARTAQVQKDARIGEAEAKRDAGIREAKAKQEKVSAQYLSEIEMAKAQRDYELKKAAYDIEVNTRRAQADLAYQLQVAKTKQQIEEQRVQVQVVERAQQVAVQEQEIARREKELEARVRKPAEAERYKLERLAEAEKSQLIMQAEAEAESVRMRGEAEAFAIGARARAEAEQMAKKAEAFQLYQEAAQLDMLLEKLPQVWRLCGHQERNRTRECRVGGNEGLGETQAGGLEIWGGNYKPVTEVRKDDPYKVKKITILKPRVRCFRRGVVRPQVLSGPLSPTRWQRRSVVP